MNAPAVVIFLDRDGVINVFPGERKYVTSLEGFFFLDGAIEGIKKLKDKGFFVYVISNQAGVSKGIYSQANLDAIDAYLIRELKKQGTALDGIYYCTHQETENCSCRKPKTGMLEKATAHLKAKRCFFVGDSLIDIEAGKNFGCTTVLVLSGRETDRSVVSSWKTKPDHVSADLKAAAEYIANLICIR